MESEQINADAFPMLIEEVPKAQTWDVESVTCGWGTSATFVESTLAAMDKAGR